MLRIQEVRVLESSLAPCYSYDDLSELTRITHPDGTVTTYKYDGLGRRIEKTVDGIATTYIYDGENILLEYDTNDILVARYTHGSKLDQPLSMERGGQNYYYHCDHRASVRVISDSAGMAVNRYDYDAYGRLESMTEGVSNPFAFTGREYDAESGFYYFRARYYDPQVGRFVTEDPILFAAGDPHLFRYVGNNPLNATDPLGLSETTVLDVALVGGGLVLGGIGLVSTAPLVGAVGAVLAVAGAAEYVGRRAATSEWNVGKPVRARKPTECEQRLIDRHDAEEIVRLIEKLEELERLDDRILTRLRGLPLRTRGDWDRFAAEYRAAGGPIDEIAQSQRELNNLRSGR